MIRMKKRLSLQEWPEFLPQLQRPIIRCSAIALLTVMIGIVLWLSLSSGPGREPADLYSLPIILAALVFGTTGALVAATACSILYLIPPWLQHLAYYYGDAAEILVFYFLGMMAARLIGEYLRSAASQKELNRLNMQLERRVADAVAAERAAQQELQDAQRLTMLGEAAAHIAHEIKNPLVSIGGFSRSIKAQIDRQHPVQEELDIIVHEVAKLEEMLRGLLDVASPGCRQRHLIDVTSLIRDVLSLVQLPAKNQGIHLDFFPPETPVSIMGDADQLNRAILNVVLNGIQAMPEGGKLTVTASSMRKEGTPSLKISVQDTGIGISPEDQHRIFQPFFTTKRSGTGLGLAFTRKAVSAHGGIVQIDSSLQTGTRVTLCFPFPDAGMDGEVRSEGWTAARFRIKSPLGHF